MENYIQEMTSLSDYHWLFADELAPGDAQFPTFVPRVLNFEKSNNQSHHSTSPSLGQDESQVPASPIYRPLEDDSDPSWATSGSEFSGCLSSSTLSKRGCLSPPHDFVSNIQYGGLKRQFEDSHEDFPRKRRCPQSPVFDANYNHTFEPGVYRPPSPIFTAYPLGQSDKPKLDPSLNPWQPQVSSRSDPSLQERNHHDSTELNESKRCIKFLIEEMKKVIESDRYGENSDITHRTIKRTEDRLKSFIQTSHIMSQIITAQDLSTESYVPLPEDINPYNPFLACRCSASEIGSVLAYDPESLPNPFLSMSSRRTAAPLETCDTVLLTHGEAGSSRSSILSNNNTAFTQSTISSNPADIQNDLTSSVVDNSNRFCLQDPPILRHPVSHLLSNNVFHQSSHNLVDHNFHSIRNIYI